MAFDTGGFSASLQNHSEFASRNTKKGKMVKRARETEREISKKRINLCKNQTTVQLCF